MSNIVLLRTIIIVNKKRTYLVLFSNRGIIWSGSLFQWGVKKELSELLMLVANADTVIAPMTNVTQAMRWRQNGPARGCKGHLC